MIKNTFLVIVGLLLLAVLVIALIALQRPDTFRVSRSATVAAPAQKIFPMINDMRAFDTWNPYALKDPQMKSTYSGPASGPGARSDFESKEAGSGSVEIIHATSPSEVKMRLAMTAPFKADNAVTFSVAPQGDATRVTWAMEGASPLLGKFMGVIFNMDKMIGNDFEQGLVNLKNKAEQA
jgi:hypothetical protein